MIGFERGFFLTVIAIFIYIMICAVRLCLDRRWARKRSDARAHATKLGMCVRDVDRKTIWHHLHARGKGLKLFQITEYFLNRQRQSDEHWSFVQRYNGEKRFHNRWTLIVNGKALTTKQLSVLEEISASEKWQEEWIEIEAFPTHISAFWDDSLGKDSVVEIYAFLSRLLDN